MRIRTTVIGFPLDGACVLITMENQAVTPSFRDDTCRHRAGQDKKSHPDKSGPERRGRQLTTLCHTVEPLERATSDAMLIADLAPRKTGVCLHQTGQKEGWSSFPGSLLPGQAPGHRTWDSLQATSFADWLLPWLSAKTHTPPH